MNLRDKPTWLLEYLAPMQCMTAEREELARRKSMHFTVSEQKDGEWALVAHQGDGSYTGIGELNSEVEATLVCKSLNASLQDPIIRDKWRDYFDF